MIGERASECMGDCQTTKLEEIGPMSKEKEKKKRKETNVIVGMNIGFVN